MYNNNCPCGYYYNRPDGPVMQYVPPATVESYVGKNITTYIQGYGRVRAYIISYEKNTGMVNLIIFTPYRQQYTQVYHGDMIGIAPYFGGGYPEGGFGGGQGGGYPGGGY